jgi:hypothetical protein
MNFAIIVLVRFCAMEQFWVAGGKKKALKALVEERSLTHAAQLI